MDSIRFPDLIERLQRVLSQRFWPSGHQANIGVGLELEPTEHFEDALKWSLHFVDGFRAPAILQEPGQYFFPSPPR